MKYEEVKNRVSRNELEAKIREINPSPNTENVLRIFNELYAKNEVGNCAACSLES